MGSHEVKDGRLSEKPLSQNQVLVIEDDEEQRQKFSIIFQNFPSLELWIPQIDSTAEIDDLYYFLGNATTIPAIVLVDQIQYPKGPDFDCASANLRGLITLLKRVNSRVWIVEYSWGSRRKMCDLSDSALSTDQLFESFESLQALSSHHIAVLRDLTNDAFVRSQSFTKDGILPVEIELADLEKRPELPKALEVAEITLPTLEEALKKANLELRGKILHDLWKIIAALKANKPIESCAVTCVDLKNLLSVSDSGLK